MSGEALKWAMDQQGSGPAMQALLLVLGLGATSPSQLCELSRADLARQTRMSQRNVTRLLAELEELGVVERDDRYISGAADGNGGREIVARLRLDRTVRLPTREERGAMPGSHDDNSDNPNVEGTDEAGRDNMSRPRSGQEPHEVGTRTPPGRDKNSTPPLYTNLEESLSSARAEAREGEKERFVEFQKRLKDDWKRFAANYPAIAGLDLERAEQEFGRLNLGDRDIAIREAAHYAAEFKASKKTFPKEAWRWVVARDFDRLAEVRQAKAEKAGLKAPLVPVRKGTRLGDAWEASDRRAGKKTFWSWSDELGCHVAWKSTMSPPDLAAAPAPEAEPAAPAPRVGADAWKTLAASVNPQPVPPEAATGPPEDEIPFE